MNHALNSASRGAATPRPPLGPGLAWPPFQARGVAFHRDLSPTGRPLFPHSGTWPVWVVVAPG